MLMVAAEYGRHDVLQYLLDSLNQIPGDGSQVLTELQAPVGCDLTDARQPCSTDEEYSEGVNSTGTHVKIHFTVRVISWPYIVLVLTLLYVH